MRRWTVAVLVGVLLLSPALGSAGAGTLPRGDVGPGPSAAGGSWSLTIAAVGTYGYQPDTFSNVPLSANVTVTFTDETELQHSFNISSREGFEIPRNWSAAQLNQLFSEYPPLYAATVYTEGDVSVGNFTSPATPGWYEFICNVTGHFTEGMYGFIAFGESLPSNLTLPNLSSSGGPSIGSALIAGIGVVLIVAVLVVVLIWRRRRSVYRLPPDRPG